MQVFKRHMASSLGSLCVCAFQEQRNVVISECALLMVFRFGVQAVMNRMCVSRVSKDSHRLASRYRKVVLRFAVCNIAGADGKGTSSISDAQTTLLKCFLTSQ